MLVDKLTKALSTKPFKKYKKIEPSKDEKEKKKILKA